MHSTKVSRTLPYSPDELLRLVSDVEQYPKFVPWVSGMRTWNRSEPAEGVTSVDAEATVKFAFVKEKFATRVRTDEVLKTVEVSLLYGPFRKLRNRWQFVPTGEGTRIDFDIEFEFKSRILEALLAANLHYAAERLISCFEARAKTLYGRPAPRAGSSMASSNI